MAKIPKGVSETVIRRMPIYHRYLADIIDKNIDRVSSSDLSRMTGFTASQIRQDLNNFGGFGQQGYGYNTRELKDQIDKILGLDNHYNSIIIGAGRLGTALAKYRGFRDSGYEVKALFDILPMKPISIEGERIDVLPMEELEKFIEEEKIDVVILTVPKSEAQKLANRVQKTNIKGIWNFSPYDISPVGNIVVENIRLNDSLLTLSYYIKEKSMENPS